MRSLIRSHFLLLSLVFLGCVKKELQTNKFIPIQVLNYTIHNPENLSFTLYDIKDDTLVYYDSWNKLLYKKSLVTFNTKKVGIDLIDDFMPIKLSYINSDSILFSKGSQLLLYQKNGETQKKFNLFSALSGIEKEVYSEYPYDGIANQLLYVPTRKSVLFYFAKAEEGNKRVFAEYSLGSESWNSLPVYHPQSLEGVKLNYTTFPSVILNPNGFAFIYSISPVMVQYFWGDSRQKEKTVSSFKGKQEAEPQTNRDDWSSEYFENWVLQSPNYLKLIFDPYRKVYYRISQEALNRSPNEGQDYYEFLIQNRQMYLTVLDPDFEVLANFPLEKAKYDPKHAFVFSKGLWIPFSETFLKSEEGLQGNLVTF